MSQWLDLSVERASEVPVGTQLAWQLRTLIATGVLPPGARLPGIRDLAESAGVNVNTVRSVLSRLEEQGLLVSEQGRGTFVAAGAHLDVSLGDVARAMITTAQESGIDPRDLAAALYVTPVTPPAQTATNAPESEKAPSLAMPPGAEDRAEKRMLYEQIERFEHEIGRLEPIGALEQLPNVPAPRILTVVELRKVRDDLAHRFDQLRREREQWRVEEEQFQAAERAGAESGGGRGAPWAGRVHRWRAGTWTGRSAALVSWTRG